jgi:hypothetical protein
MRRYNLYKITPHTGRFELIKDVPAYTGNQETTYWAECFTWQELKKIIPYLRKRGWKLVVEPVDEDDLYGKMHIYSFTCGVNNETQIISLCGIRIIMARDIIVSRKQKTY